MKAHLARAKALHEADLASGYGDVEMPHSLALKYPRAAYEWGWKFAFPSRKLSTDPRTGVLLGHASVETTMIYTHVMNKGGRGVKSPLDRLEQPRAAYAA